jgi:hypothetical protein
MRDTFSFVGVDRRGEPVEIELVPAPVGYYIYVNGEQRYAGISFTEAELEDRFWYIQKFGLRLKPKTKKGPKWFKPVESSISA